MDRTVEARVVQYTQIAESIVQQWDSFENEGLNPQFSFHFLRDIFFIKEIGFSKWETELPSAWFNFILNDNNVDKSLQRKLLFVLKKYVEEFETTKINCSDGTAICLYHLLRKKDEVTPSFKELLFVMYIKNHYYKDRDYRFVERFTSKIMSSVQNEIYLEEIQHLRLLCLKNMFRYSELESELKQYYSNGHNRPKSLLRYGSFYILLDRFEEAIDLYYQAVNQRENLEVASHALFVLQELHRFSIDEELMMKLEKLHLVNIEEQLKSRFEGSFQAFDIRNKLSEYERDAIQFIGDHQRAKDKRKRKNRSGSDHYLKHAYNVLIQSSKLIENIGLPDFMIGQNKAMKMVAEWLIMEGGLQISHRYLGMGLNFKDLKLNNDELLLYQQNHLKLFKWMYGQLHQMVTVLENRSSREVNWYSLFEHITDALLTQIDLLYRVLSVELIELLVDPLLRILKLDIQSLNSFTTEFLAKVINDLKPARSVEVFQQYLNFLGENTNTLGFYNGINQIRFNGWSNQELEFFDYGILKTILNRVHDKNIFSANSFYYMIFNIHAISPIPPEHFQEIKVLLKQIYEDLNGYNKDHLLRLMFKYDMFSDEEARNEVHNVIERYVQDNMLQINTLNILADLIPVIHEDQIERIILKARSHRTNSKRINFFISGASEQLEESYQIFVLRIAQFRKTPDILFDEHYGIEKLSSMTFNLLKEARESFDSNVSLVEEMNKRLKYEVLNGSKKERIKSIAIARGWMRNGQIIYDSDTELANVIESFVWDSSNRVKAWSFSFLTDYYSNDSVKNDEQIINLFTKIKDTYIDETDEDLMIAITFFLSRFNKVLSIGECKDAFEKWVYIIEQSSYLSVQKEWLGAMTDSPSI
ncbi:hypothetical protein JNUCC31_23150 [Paenibacillus sp. JNUCC31]|uniref:hypothetical protein n=1 Tax=Paenibacillus sp. JNUCC-31 TaxID=2777983 RepID=UPI00177CCF3B|nr:hypothetical protein [Paenibacillus sp. JNUCC-31]QOS77642.1 hypothetical protein JNUCC31_23150 [Paenibacillus sp. JNUCC-31]